jgi:hypothetical protein
MTDDYILFAIYFIVTCSVNYIQANQDSFIGVHIRDGVRAAFGLFAFRWPRISLLAFLSQIYADIMLILFIASRFFVIEFLQDTPGASLNFSADAPVSLFTILVLTNWGIMLLAAIEVGLCNWIRSRRR